MHDEVLWLSIHAWDTLVGACICCSDIKLIFMQWWIALLIVLGVCLVIAILVVIAGKPTLIYCSDRLNMIVIKLLQLVQLWD